MLSEPITEHQTGDDLVECDYKGCKTKINMFQVDYIIFDNAKMFFCEAHYTELLKLNEKYIPALRDNYC